MYKKCDRRWPAQQLRALCNILMHVPWRLRPACIAPAAPLLVRAAAVNVKLVRDIYAAQHPADLFKLLSKQRSKLAQPELCAAYDAAARFPSAASAQASPQGIMHALHLDLLPRLDSCSPR